ncbi:hypothetical protein L1280_000757 [Deinococcus sp. HSC-46F16]|uniref:hypothetical protein n=1 Tax=Deinococcus sp. HSC-46F16 TaxID=2910968 RepID=UPI00209D9EEE|nr:hypothetical protein [Deinococcus sp. HSC-46F16]MCP2013629.1 hypothetical protein [Deinococcus sp. HSC-46F16]
MTEPTPPEVLAGILARWQRREYAELARWLPASGARPDPWRTPTGREVKAARLHYRRQPLRNFRILAATDTDPAAANVVADLFCVVGGELEWQRRRYRMIYLGPDGRPRPRGGPDGLWVPLAVYAVALPPGLRA